MKQRLFWQLPEDEVTPCLERLAWLAGEETCRETPWLEVVPSAFGLQLKLLLPVTPDYNGAAAACADQLGRVLTQVPRPEGALPLAPATALLLEHLSGDQPLGADETNHFLVISAGADRTRLGEIAALLRDHATAVRVAAVDMAAVKSESARFTLFHVLDDTRRRSLFQALAASDLLADCRILQGFSLGGLQLFCSRRRRFIETAVMQQLVFLCGRRPAWFGFQRNLRERGLFAAFDGPDEPAAQDPWRFWPLSDLDFTGFEQLEPTQSSQEMRFQQVSLNNSPQALADLQQLLQEQAPDRGRRLFLRDMPDSGDQSFERRSLRERIAELEYRLAFLDRAEVSQPWLWRFDRTRLPLLAEILRGLPANLLHHGPLRYGFFADEFEPGGFHYLLVPGDQMVLEDDILYRVLHEEAGLCAFWLDPYWARYYGESTPECAVFVPRGQALFPPLHQWQAQNNASFFRHMVSRWFREDAPKAALPNRPLYLFEADPFHPERLRLQVLDEEAFVPLNTRLAWLNSNLTITRHVESEVWLADLGEQARRTELNQAMSRRLAGAERTFEEEGRRLGQAVSVQVQGLFDLLTRESQAVMEEAWRTADELSRLKQGLTRLTRVKKDMDEMLDEAQDHLRETEQQSSALSRELQVLETKLKQAMRARRRMSDEVIDEVRALQELHDDLKQRFNKMMKPGADR